MLPLINWISSDFVLYLIPLKTGTQNLFKKKKSCTHTHTDSVIEA